MGKTSCCFEMFPSMPESNLAATTHGTLRIFGGAVAQLRARGDLGGQTYWCSGLKILQKPPRYTTNGIGRIVLERTGIAKVSATFPFRSDHPLGRRRFSHRTCRSTHRPPRLRVPRGAKTKQCRAKPTGLSTRRRSAVARRARRRRRRPTNRR